MVSGATTPQTGKPGHNKTFSDAAIQFCLTIKCLFSLPLRQALGLVQSLLRMTNLTWSAPEYSFAHPSSIALPSWAHPIWWPWHSYTPGAGEGSVLDGDMQQSRVDLVNALGEINTQSRNGSQCQLGHGVLLRIPIGLPCFHTEASALVMDQGSPFVFSSKQGDSQVPSPSIHS